MKEKLEDIRNQFKSEFVELLTRWNAEFRIENNNETNLSYSTDLMAVIKLRDGGPSFDIGTYIAGDII